MGATSNTPKNRNLLLLALLLVSMLFSAFDEGYLPIISPFLWASIAAGFGVSIWLARTAPAERLMALSLSIFVMEYMKESMGIRAGLWTYHGHTGRYVFGVWVWVLVGMVAYTVSTRLIYPRLRKPERAPRWLSPLLLVAVSLSIPMLLWPYSSGCGVFFYIFYALLLLIGCVAAYRTGFAGFASFVIAAWALAAPSEAAGSIASGVWTYPHDADGPPLFLVVGCWPLEIVAQAGLCSLFIGQPIVGPMPEAPA